MKKSKSKSINAHCLIVHTCLTGCSSSSFSSPSSNGGSASSRNPSALTSPHTWSPQTTLASRGSVISLTRWSRYMMFRLQRRRNHSHISSRNLAKKWRESTSCFASPFATHCQWIKVASVGASAEPPRRALSIGERPRRAVNRLHCCIRIFSRIINVLRSKYHFKRLRESS